MDFDFYSLFRNGTWLLNIALVAIAGGISFYRGKIVLGVGFLFLFVLNAFTFMWNKFLYEWIVDLFDFDMYGTLYDFYWGVNGVLLLIAWAVICGGLVGIGAKTK